MKTMVVSRHCVRTRNEDNSSVRMGNEDNSSVRTVCLQDDMVSGRSVRTVPSRRCSVRTQRHDSAPVRQSSVRMRHDGAPMRCDGVS
jgi:hypothetical protein